VIVLPPTVWAIGLSQRVDHLQGLRSAAHTQHRPEEPFVLRGVRYGWTEHHLRVREQQSLPC
jgi:hypothetical protein